MVSVTCTVMWLLQVSLTVWWRDFWLMRHYPQVALKILSRACCVQDLDFGRYDTQRYACKAFANRVTSCTTLSRPSRGRLQIIASRSQWFFQPIAASLDIAFANVCKSNGREHSLCGCSVLDQYDFEKNKVSRFRCTIDYRSDCTWYNIVFLAPPSSQQLWQGSCLLSLVFLPLLAEDR